MKSLQPQLQPLSEEEIVHFLKHLPRLSRNPKAEVVFYKRLKNLSKPSIKWFSWPKFALTGGILSVLLLSSITFAAYQSSVTYGTLLYPWKQAIEKVELAFAFSQINRIDVHLKISDRRLDEAEQILKNSGKLGWIIPKALADSDGGSLNQEERNNLELTLNDMHSEVDAASDIATSAEFEVMEAEQILSKIENTASRHVERLGNLANRSKNEVILIIQKFAYDEDNNVALVVEAREGVKQAIAAKQKKIKVQFKKRQEKFNQRLEQATEEFQETNNLFMKLPEVQRTLLGKKFQAAEEALKTGKLGMAKGLSRALKEQMENKQKRQSPQGNILENKNAIKKNSDRKLREA